MKLTLRSSLACLAVAGCFSAVQADVTIRITGSTAFRSAVFNALKGPNFFDVTPVIFDGTSQNQAAASSANPVTFVGTNTACFGAGVKVIIECSYSGSTEGLTDLLGVSSIVSPIATPKYLVPTGATSATLTSGLTADYAFCDIAKDSTQVDSTSFTGLNDYGIAPAYSGNGVGVVTFGFVRNVAPSASILSNLTTLQAQTLLGGGSVKAGLITGNTNHTGLVYMVGRYSLSGTHQAVSAVTGFPLVGDQQLFALDGASTGSYFKGSTPTQPNVSNSSFSNGGTAGTGGFVSGGDVAKLLNNPGTTNVFIGYLGLGDVSGAKLIDGTTAAPLNGNLLTYNGVAATKANVRAGTYDFWTYEHLYYNDTTANDSAKKKLVTFGGSSPLTTAHSFAYALDQELQADANYVSHTQMKAIRSGSDGSSIVE